MIVGKAECPWARALPIFYNFISAVFAWPLGAGMYCEAGFRVLFLVVPSNFNLNLERIELHVEFRRRSAVLLVNLGVEN